MFIEEWKIVIYMTCFLFLGRNFDPCALDQAKPPFFGLIFMQVIIQEIACSLYKDSWRMKYEHQFFFKQFLSNNLIVIWCDNYRILTFRIISTMIALYHQAKTPIFF